MASMKMEHLSIPSLNLLLSRTRSLSTPGIFSPKAGSSHIIDTPAPSPRQGGVLQDQPCRQQQAAIVVLPDGSLVLFDEDKAVTVADVLRQHPWHELVSEELPKHRLSSHERLQEGRTYLLRRCRSRSRCGQHRPTMILPSLHSLASLPSPLDLHHFNSVTTVHTPPPQMPVPHSLWRHSSENLDHETQAFRKETEMKMLAAVGGCSTQRQRLQRHPDGTLLRHVSTDLASLSPSVTSSDATPTRVDSCLHIRSQHTTPQEQSHRPLRREATAVAGMTSFTASDPVRSSRVNSNNLFVSCPTAADQRPGLVRHRSANLPGTRKSESSNHRGLLCSRCFQEGFPCGCPLFSPKPDADPSPRSVFPQWGYNYTSWQDGTPPKDSDFEGETAVLDRCQPVRSVPKGPSSMVDEENQPDLTESLTLWRLEFPVSGSKDRQERQCGERGMYAGAVSPSPRAQSCLIAAEGGVRFATRIKYAVIRLTRWNSVPVKDLEL